ncbi:hypothetical protein Tco_0558844 [Tanacetum coccineum]
MTPAARIKAIDELSKHSLSWYKEEEYKENDFDKVRKHINDFEHNISVLNEEVRMVQHQYKTPNDERDSLLEETFKNLASDIKTIEKNLIQIAESIHGRGVGTLLCFTETNPRGLAHAITNHRQSGITKNVVDLGASISLMPYSMFLRLNLGDLKPTRMCIELANKTTVSKRDCGKCRGRPFLVTAHAMIDVFNKKISFEVGDEIITFDLQKSMRFPLSDEDTCHSANITYLSVVDSIKEILPQNHDNSIEPILDHLPEDCNNPSLFAANSIDEEIPTPKLKELPSHLEYAFLNNNREYLSSSLRYYLARKKGWRVCIDYRKLNDATRKDQFPLPFIDQMLERLSGNEYYCFLEGLSRYFQIPLAPEDQEKTTFTYPYGTFASEECLSGYVTLLLHFNDA